MRTTWLPLVAIVIATQVAAGDYIDISMYPYYQSPATAWRVVVQADGIVAYYESSQPVEVPSLPVTDEPDWVDVPGSLAGRVSDKEWNRLVEVIQEIGLETLEPHYSASYSVQSEDPEDWFAIVVTHGANYRIRIDIGQLEVDSAVYAPMKALEQQDPTHPHHEEIRKIITTWYHVLRTVGPVDDYRTKDYRRWVK